MTRVSEVVRSLFPPEIEVEGGWSGEIDGPLFPEEETLIARAVEKRRRTFRAGRVLARRALLRLGVPPTAIPAQERRPVWPAGFVGTIAHTDECCAAAVARAGEIAGVGVDVEVDGAATEHVFRLIATDEELTWLRAHAVPTIWATVLFSAKEAFYKSLAAVHPKFVGFHDVRVDIDTEAGTFGVVPLDDAVRSAVAGLRVEGAWRREGGWVFATVVLRRRAGVSAAL